MMTASAMERSVDESSGGRLVTVDGRALPLLGARITARAAGGIARTVLEQRFRNPYPDPLRVTYLFPLPHDAAVSGFAFTIGDRRVVGEVDRREAARERFEEAIASGRTAALVEEERGSVFTQEVGNLPPGAELLAELTVDQRLAWLPAGAWEWRFPTALAPRYQGALGRVADAERIRVDVAVAPLAPRVALALRVEDALAEGGAAESPSHAVVFRTAAGALEASFAAEGGVPLDRDVVVRWPVAAPGAGAALATFRAAAGPLAESAHALLTLVPPAADAGRAPVPRDLVVLLDTSGSMEGEPLAHAVRVVSALVDGLRDEDSLELVEFSDAPRRWRRAPVRATRAERDAAKAWLARLRASGSTEMRLAVKEALAGLRRDAQRQVLLVTDGHIGFETEIVAELAAGLPAGSRLHALGVGSSVNRSLLGPAARAGRGTESIVGLGEDVERAVATLAARMEAPLVTDVTLSGDALLEHAPERIPDLLAGSPALVAVRLRPEGGVLRVEGHSPEGAWTRAIAVPPVAPGAGLPAVAALFGREAVEDLELRLAAGEEARAIDAAVERLGLAYQLATRLTSWVAISEEPSVDPTRPTRRAAIPQALPYGMSVEGLGLRAARFAPFDGSYVMMAESDLSARELAGPPRATRVLRQPVLSPAPRARERPHLRGRVVLDRDGELLVEVEVSGALAWSPPGEVTLVLRDGTRVEARVLPDRTTASGALAAGQTLRLALAFEGGAVGGFLSRIEADVDGEPIAIALRGHSRRGDGR